MITTCPCRRAIIPGNSARVTWYSALKLTSTIPFHSDGVRSRNGFTGPAPALFTRTCASTSFSDATPSAAPERASIDSLVSAELSGTPIAGVSAAVVKGRDTIVMRGWGFADIENDVPVTPASVFRIGSITKQFTSAAIMQLVEQKKLG